MKKHTQHIQVHTSSRDNKSKLCNDPPAVPPRPQQPRNSSIKSDKTCGKAYKEPKYAKFVMKQENLKMNPKSKW